MSETAHSSFEAAREQAAALLGFVASERITLPNGAVYEIPNPSLLDDDQQARLNALDLEVETWDRHDDVLNEDGSVKVRGALKHPARKNGELVEPYNTRLAKAIFGDRYDEFKAAGGRGNDVHLVWSKMNQIMAERRAADSKSAGSDSAVAAVSDADRVGAGDVQPASDSGVAEA